MSKGLFTLWMVLIGSFLIATDYTIQKTDWENVPDPFEIKLRVKVKEIPYDRIELIDGYYLPVRDTLYEYTYYKF